MTVDELYDMLRKVQEPKGFYFNADRDQVNQILEGLLQNKENNGYMSCPCRLAHGERAKDQDIICPCVYRAKDVAEYGSCYCNLYVSQEWNEGKVPHVYVPERRPTDKVLGQA